MLSISTTTFLAVAWLSLTSAVDARTAAVPAIQKLSSRAEYQGGWALALEGSASTTCPADAPVLCSSDLVTPGCCPAGQTCINGSGADANYCCPTTADCNTAVLNFPQCANTTWNMFQDRLGGYFCCEQGQIAVQSEFAGRNGPLCEPPDQVVPSSLLATLYPQATPTASSTPSNTTEAGNTNQTNPVASVSATGSSSSSSSSSDPLSGIAAWPNSKKIGLGVAAFVAVVFAVVVCSFLNRRRRNRNVIRGYNGYGYAGEDTYDEFGNLVPRAAYGVSRVGLAGYEPYRRGTPGPSSEGNHVTVNVVHGDQTT